MARTIETNGLFKPNPSKQETKAQLTDSVVRTIQDAEAKARDAKTARLREMRLKMEADAPPPPAKPAPKARKRAAKA